MKKILLVLVFLAITGSSYCQSDISYKKALVRLFTANGSLSSYKIIMDNTFTALKKMDTKYDNEELDIIKEDISDITTEDLAEVFYDIYKPLLAEDDLIKLSEFYESPAGKKYIKVLPDILKQNQEGAKKLIGIVIKKLEDKIKKEEQ